MPKDPNAVRYKAPEQRGFARIYVKEDRKPVLQDAAKKAGFATLDDYIWHLHQQAQKSASK
jgi:hypothetical protein